MTRSVLLSFLSLAFLAIGTSRGYSEPLEHYKMTFNTQRSAGLESTSSSYKHNFVPRGWSGHVVDSYKGEYSTSYTTYYYSTTDGVDNSGALGIESQIVENSDGDTLALQDLLVTPLVRGTVTLDVKQRSKSYSEIGKPSITFYKMTKNADGSFTRGDSIALGDLTLTRKYQTVTFSLDEDTYIGIRGSIVWMDNFTAEYADVDTAPSLFVNSVKSKNNGVYDANENNAVPFKFDVVLINDGVTDLHVGDPKYELVLLNGYDGDSIASFPIDQPLAAGAQDTIHINQEIDVTKLPSAPFQAYVKENLTGSEKSLAYVTIVPYKPIITLTETNSENVLSSYDFGYSKKAVSHRFYLRNAGAKALNITGVTVPEGFESSLTGPASVAPHDTLGVTLTLKDTQAGERKGLFIINGEDDVADTLELSGVIIDSTLWYTDFEDCSTDEAQSFPAGFMAEDDNWTISDYPADLNLADNKLAAFNSSTRKQGRLVTPLLEVKEGESLSFEAAKGNAYGSTPKLDVYYSADRKNWTLLRSITEEGEDGNPQTQFSDKNVGTSSWNTQYAFKRFTIDQVPAGQYYLAFDGAQVYIDNLLGFKRVELAHDLLMTASRIDTTGMVNYAGKASATVYNSNSKAEEAGSYTARLYLDGEVVAEAAAPKIGKGESVDFSFEFTPHTTGRFPAWIEFDFNGYKLTSDTDTVTISAEVASNNVQIGSPAPNGAATTAPVNLTSRHSQGIILLTRDDLKDLAPGTVVKSLKLRGAASTTRTSHTGDQISLDNLKFYVLNTDSTKLPEFNRDFELTSFVDTTQAKPVFDGSYTVEEGGTFQGSRITEPADLIKFDFNTPFVYNGQSIVIVGQHDASSQFYNFLLESSTKENGAVRTGYSTGNYGSWYSYYGDSNPMPSPVVYLGLESAPTSVSGTVTDATTGVAVPDLPVIVSSGNVVYSDTTDANGAYHIDILQSRLEYTLSTERGGYDPYADSLSVASGSQVRDIRLNPATGLYIVNRDIPAEGEVNTLITAKATVRNVIADSIGADEYTASFYVDGKVVDTSDTKTLAPGESTQFAFSFTPHEAGTVAAYAKFEYKGHAYVTDTVSIKVDGEVFHSAVVVNDSTGLTTSDYSNYTAPFNTYTNYSYSDIVYSKERLGLPTGAVIKNIAFRGNYTYYSYQHGDSLALQVYIENTDASNDVPASEFTPADTTKMQKVFDSKIYFPVDNDTLLSIPLDGFTYTGENIRLFVAGFTPSASMTTSFVTDNTVTNQTWVKDHGTSSYSQRNATWTQLGAQPVMYLEVVPSKKISGKVVAKKHATPIPGVKVSLVSDNILYTGTSDENGEYSIEIGKYSRTYQAIFEAEGYKADTVASISFANDVVLNDSLSTLSSVKGVVKGVSNGDTLALAHADILVADKDNKTVAEVESDENGKFEYELVDAEGEYALIVSKDKYTSDSLTIVLPGDTTVEATLTHFITISGNVVTTEDTISYAAAGNVTVLLVDSLGNNIASTLTNEAGEYAFDITKTIGDYKVVANKEGYVTDSVTINANDDDVTASTLTLKSVTLTGIGSIETKSGLLRGSLYTINGQYLGKDVDPRTLRRGVYIVNGKKFVVK